MIQIPSSRVIELFEAFTQMEIVVIGDLMLDNYVWGSVTRISPEAPVPVVEVQSESSSLGGAANVAHNIATLGATAIPLGVVGDDQGGETIRKLLRRLKFATNGVLTDHARTTTVKTRIIAHGQHVVRTDRESKEPMNKKMCEQILAYLGKIIDRISAIVIEDYNKGFITSDLIRGVLSLAGSNDKRVMVDPKFNHFFEYRGVAVIKPNRREAEEVLGIRLNSETSIIEAGNTLLARLGCENVLLTLGEDGMYLFESNGDITHVETRARKVHDVSGAGDTVISTYSLALAAGATPREAATIANYAAGLVCEEVGIVPIQRDLLLNQILEDNVRG